jgi:RNA polymerase sigma factor (sigma-70 family)
MHNHAPGGGLEQGRDDIVDWVAREVLPHEKRVRSWVTRALRDPADADDVVQEAYCKLAGLSSVDHIEHGGAYFFATARSIVLQRVRREKTVLIDVARDADMLDSYETEDPSPERVVGARRELHHVLKMIAGLPAAYQRVIELRRIQGHSQKETASILGITENMVENHSTRALRMILQALAGQDGTGGAQNAPSTGPEIDARTPIRSRH